MLSPGADEGGGVSPNAGAGGGLNAVSNSVIKTILRGDDIEAEALRESIVALTRGEEDEERVRFFTCLTALLEHTTSPESDSLRGSYRLAYHRILAMVEDAGWKLTEPAFIVTG